MPQKIQELLFSKSESESDVNDGNGWTVSAAKAWLTDHDMKSEDPVDDNPDKDFYHFRQFDSELCTPGSFKILTENFPVGVKATSCNVPERGRSVDDRPRFREVRSLFPECRDLELRVEGTAAQPRIVGYAAVWDQETELYPGYREVVRRGAFSASIERDDVLGLFEHREDRLLARSSARTLELAEDDHGLRFAMAPRDASWIREDVLEPIRRRELRGSSVGFYTVQDRITRDPDKRGELRELLETVLIDVSPVARPAYPGTEIALRSRAGDLPALLVALRRQGLDERQIRSTFEAALAGLPSLGERHGERPPESLARPDPDYFEKLRARIPPPAGS